MADEADSKSVDGNIVRVQVPLPALFNQEQRINRRRSVYFFARVHPSMHGFSCRLFSASLQKRGVFFDFFKLLRGILSSVKVDTHCVWLLIYVAEIFRIHA